VQRGRPGERDRRRLLDAERVRTPREVRGRRRDELRERAVPLAEVAEDLVTDPEPGHPGS
jgi:hypothetical protein